MQDSEKGFLLCVAIIGAMLLSLSLGYCYGTQIDRSGQPIEVVR